MPFGLQTKALIIGLLLGWLAIPFLLAMLKGATGRRSAV